MVADVNGNAVDIGVTNAVIGMHIFDAQHSNTLTNSVININVLDLLRRQKQYSESHRGHRPGLESTWGRS
jgi:hypothetical protein